MGWIKPPSFFLSPLSIEDRARMTRGRRLGRRDAERPDGERAAVVEEAQEDAAIIGHSKGERYSLSLSHCRAPAKKGEKRNFNKIQNFRISHIFFEEFLKEGKILRETWRCQDRNIEKQNMAKRLIRRRKMKASTEDESETEDTTDTASDDTRTDKRKAKRWGTTATPTDAKTESKGKSYSGGKGDEATDEVLSGSAKGYKASYDGEPYAVAYDVPTTPVLMRCPHCHSTLVSYIQPKDVRQVRWLCGCFPKCSSAMFYYHYCNGCDKAVARITDEDFSLDEEGWEDYDDDDEYGEEDEKFPGDDGKRHMEAVDEIEVRKASELMSTATSSSTISTYATRKGRKQRESSEYSDY